MQIGLPDDSKPVRDMFERRFVTESTTQRVRAAEPVGFDAAYWRTLVALDVPFMRLAEKAGGGGMSLFDACIMMEEAGRHLAPAPFAETIVAQRFLGEIGSEVAAEWIEKVRDGETILMLALNEARNGEVQLVPGGAVAAGALVFDGKQLAIESPGGPLAAPETLKRACCFRTLRCTKG